MKFSLKKTIIYFRIVFKSLDCFRIPAQTIRAVFWKAVEWKSWLQTISLKMKSGMPRIFLKRVTKKLKAQVMILDILIAMRMY